MFRFLTDRQGASRHDHQDDGFSGLGQGLHHPGLGTGQVEVGTATCLAGEDRFLAGKEEDDIRFLSRFDRLGDVLGVLVTAIGQTGFI